MNYFQIRVYYTKQIPHPSKGSRATGHVVRAKNLQDALKIATKHGIAYQFNSPFVRKRLGQKLYERHPFHKALIKRRKKGIGGSIWYEDKNGKLQKEKHEKN